MALSILLIASLAGLMLAIIGCAAFGLSLLAGLGLWIVFGLVTAGLGLALMMIRRPRGRCRALHRSEA